MGFSQSQVKGTAVVVKKNFLHSVVDWEASVADRLAELRGNRVSFQLVSSTIIDPDTGIGKVGKPTYLKRWIRTVSNFSTGESYLEVNFKWDESQGTPGAVIVKNNHPYEFFLKHLTIENLPGKGRVHFVCNSWIYPNYSYDRIFFTNDAYLPSQTPELLRPFRELELCNLRGDHGYCRPLKEKDRIYDYAVYNDLGNPDSFDSYVRPVLGGSQEKPYPRRGRTGRKPTRKDPNSESTALEDIYVPQDEQFGVQKTSDLLVYKVKSLGHALFPALNFLKTLGEFDSFEDTIGIYKGRENSLLAFFRGLFENTSIHILREFTRRDSEHALRLPEPQLIKENKIAWSTDEEFARQMLAGTNPVVIRCLEEFPPKSKLNPKIYGDQTSKIRQHHIEPNLKGFTAAQAVKQKRLFILDHHDTYMPHLKNINKLKGNFVYATRTILFLRDDGTLKPVAIELSLPYPDGWTYEAESWVHTPPPDGVEGSIWQLAKVESWVHTPPPDDVEHSIWQLAKTYVSVNDTAYHQLISHWLNTHAVVEPFVIATNRHLSVMHPIHKLLNPHFKDTMKINALARQSLINANGTIEKTFFPGKYALELSSDIYKSWKFTEQGLPQDLLKRGVAVEDPRSPNKLRLLIKDYPYAVDGLAVWSAIEAWVYEYCSIYYIDDNTIKADTELQAWWKEIREVGHGDLKDETWWPTMQTYKELADTCTTLIWVASALHAAVNFGQYPYGGYHPNRPTRSRRPMPKLGTEQYEDLKKEPIKVFLKTITHQKHIIRVSIVTEILSRHPSDEVYLGQRDSEEWTSDNKALSAFNQFTQALIGIEQRITEMNKDTHLKNRRGLANMPYTLLYPCTSDRSRRGTSVVGKGIPNSVSI